MRGLLSQGGRFLQNWRCVDAVAVISTDWAKKIVLARLAETCSGRFSRGFSQEPCGLRRAGYRRWYRGNLRPRIYAAKATASIRWPDAPPAPPIKGFTFCNF